MNLLLALVVFAGGGCDEQPTAAVESDGAQTQEVQGVGSPDDGSKVAPDREAIAAMLRRRFGDRAVRSMRIEVADDGQDVRVRLRGEVPTEALRDAIQQEVASRVERMRFQDFDLGVSGPVPLVKTIAVRNEDQLAPVISADLRYAALYSRSAVEIWDLAAERPVNRLDTFKLEMLKTLAISPDGRLLATGHAHAQIVLWDMPQGVNPRELVKPQDPRRSNDVAALAVSPDGKLLASIAQSTGELWLWDVGTSRGARLLGTHLSNQKYVLAFSPDGKTLASADDRGESLTLWDVASRTKRRSLPVADMYIEALAWSPDSRFLAVGRHIHTMGVRVVDVATGAARAFDPQNGGTVTAVAFSPDGKTLATQHKDAGLILWDVTTGKAWQQLGNEEVGVGRTIAFSADGGTLALVCHGREPWSTEPAGVQFWDVSARPGAASIRHISPPPVTNPLPPRDDLLQSQIAATVTRDPRIVRDFSAEVLPDGGIILRGTVNSPYFMENMVRDIQIRFPMPEEQGGQKRKIINELKVDPRIATEP